MKFACEIKKTRFRIINQMLYTLMLLMTSLRFARLINKWRLLSTLYKKIHCQSAHLATYRVCCSDAICICLLKQTWFEIASILLVNIDGLNPIMFSQTNFVAVWVVGLNLNRIFIYASNYTRNIDSNCLLLFCLLLLSTISTHYSKSELKLKTLWTCLSNFYLQK